MAPPAPPPPDDQQVNGENTPTAGAMTNGPTNSATGGLVWERAWTVDEIRKGAGNWSLAGDSGLLLLLQEFSQRIISQTHEIEKEVDGLVHTAKTSGVKLDNVFNDFIMLANTQFVENRVYDEDISQEGVKVTDQKQQEQEKTREQREAELVPKISQALNFGIKVIDEAFETLDVNAAISDSEDEEIPYKADPILEPKDPYVTRPLPHIIGSSLFMQEDDVGLVEPPSDAETESHGSISESEAEEEEKGESEYSSEGEYSESESEDDRPTKPAEQRKTIHSTSSESENEGDLFGGKNSEEDFNSEDENEQQQQQPKKPMDFTSELASKIGVPSKAPPTQESDEEGRASDEEIMEQKTKGRKDRSESNVGKNKKKHHDHKNQDRSKSKFKNKEKNPVEEDADPFGGGPEEDDSPFGKAGLFSASKGLFDDDADQGGLFDDLDPKPQPPKVVVEEAEVEENEEPPHKVESRPRTRSGKKVPAGGISIFGGGDDDLFTESTRETKPNNVESSKGQTKPVSGGLFDDEDDLFAPVSSSKPGKHQSSSKPEKSKTSATKTTSATKPAVDSLFDEDDEDDLFGDRTATKTAEDDTPVEEKKEEKPKKKLPAGAVSMFGNAPNPLAAALKQKLGVENSDDEENVSDESKSRSGSVRSSHSAVSSTSSLNKPVEALKKGDNPSPSASSNSLFADEPEDDLFTSKAVSKSTSKVSKKKTSLFSEEDDTEGDLFGTKSSSGSFTKKTTTTTTTVEKKSVRSGSLFGAEDDNADDDLFGIAPPKPRADSGRKKPVGGVALFGGADLFGKKDTTPNLDDNNSSETKPVENKHEVIKPTPRKNTLSLFGEEEDLFGTGSKDPTKPDRSSSQKETKPGSKTKSVFADEDVLFGGPETQSVDLFGASPPGTPQKTQTKPKTTPPSTVPSSGISIKGATTLSTSSDLFGSVEEEDLFGGKSESKETGSPQLKNGKVQLNDATTTESTDIVEEKTEEEVTAPKSKKPIGGVSMFGGLDPLAGLKKKHKAPVQDPLFGEESEEGPLFSKPSEKKTTDVTAEPEPAPKPSVVKPKKPVGGVSMFGGFDPLSGLKNKTSSKPEEKEDKKDVDSAEKFTNETETEEDSASPARKGVGKLKANLLINPAALLPGAAPPVKEVEPVAVGFDQPAEASTLHTASKDRVKIITRRRPMSRKARKQAALSAELDLDPEEIMSGEFSSASISSILEKKSKRNSEYFRNEDIMSISSGDTDSILKLGQQVTVTESYQDDIFNKKFTKTSVKKSAIAISEEGDDDLFGSVSTVSKSSHQKSAIAISEETDGDLFSSATTTVSKTTTTKATSEQNVISKPSLVKDEGDDLFSAGKSENTKKTATSEKTSENRDQKVNKVPSGGDSGKGDKSGEKSNKVIDEDDIFADSSILKKKETKPTVEDDIFADSILNKPVLKTEVKIDDDDDLFTGPVTKKDKKKKPVSKDEDLFKDNTDIFADLPASKPKEKKKKKTSTTTKKSVFKDDVDDIFADSSLQAKPKKESDKKKKATSKKKEFDDIFDDPLNAAGP